ncbi:MAG TPA: DNA-3-methyladenine glycosylase 2 family protein [Kofleriaceae bacterium]|nr:DNA-3-methyladenine glycosylase 2 family protein [Kofleriaceae bacterium]
MAVPRLDVDGALRHLRRADPELRGLITRHGPPSFKRTRDPFASLMRAIVYQQLSGSAASTIYGRFLGLFGGAVPRPEQLLAVSAEQLRAVGLSRGKASFLHDLAAHFSDGLVDPRRFGRASDDEIAAMLLAVKGIGPWSVDMFLMFGLVRPDVLPVGDLGVRKGMRLHFGLRSLPEAARMHKLAEPWRPFRSVASWYMWRRVEEESR